VAKNIGTGTNPLEMAEDFFDLDASKPDEARMLLLMLADVIFRARKKGRREKSRGWDRKRLYQLGSHRNELEKAKPGISDSAAAAEIKNRFSEYRHVQIETLRQRMARAKDVFRIVNELEPEFEKGGAAAHAAYNRLFEL
jgi:hypothetical protein